MRSVTQRLLVIACLTCAAIPLKSSAACLPAGTPCEEMSKADVVFIAEVVDTTFVERRDQQGRPYPDGIANYRFNILESSKGINAGELRAQFYFGLELDRFRSGGRYLIFANRAVTGIYKSGCSLTREITKTGEEEWLPSMQAELRLCQQKR